MRNRVKFTKHEIETAIRVVMQSGRVTNWVESEAKFLGVDINTPAGQEFYERNVREQAEKIIGSADIAKAYLQENSGYHIKELPFPGIIPTEIAFSFILSKEP